MTDADREKLRAVRGCGYVVEHGDTHKYAMYEIDSCDKCLDLLMEAARAGAVEECAKVAANFATENYGQGIHAVEWARPVPMCREIANALLALLHPPSPSAAEGARGGPAMNRHQHWIDRIKSGEDPSGIAHAIEAEIELARKFERELIAKIVEGYWSTFKKSVNALVNKVREPKPPTVKREELL